MIQQPEILMKWRPFKYSIRRINLALFDTSYAIKIINGKLINSKLISFHPNNGFHKLVKSNLLVFFCSKSIEYIGKLWYKSNLINNEGECFKVSFQLILYITLGNWKWRKIQYK